MSISCTHLFLTQLDLVPNFWGKNFHSADRYSARNNSEFQGEINKYICIFQIKDDRFWLSFATHSTSFRAQHWLLGSRSKRTPTCCSTFPLAHAGRAAFTAWRSQKLEVSCPPPIKPYRQTHPGSSIEINQAHLLSFTNLGGLTSSLMNAQLRTKD